MHYGEVGGDYIDLGTNLLGNGTTKDWRILYRENGLVYAILADNLSVSTDQTDRIAKLKDLGLEPRHCSTRN